jgi:hypothetical protein
MRFVVGLQCGGRVVATGLRGYALMLERTSRAAYASDEKAVESRLTVH